MKDYNERSVGMSIGTGTATERIPDSFDRIKEITACIIDRIETQTSILANAFDRLLGRNQPSSSGGVSSVPPRPSINDRNLLSMLNELEMAQKGLDVQIARIREQLP